VKACGADLGFSLSVFLAAKHEQIAGLNNDPIWNSPLIASHAFSQTTGDNIQFSVTWKDSVTDQQRQNYVNSLTYWCYAEFNYGYIGSGGYLPAGGVGCLATWDSNILNFEIAINDHKLTEPTSVSFTAVLTLADTSSCTGPSIGGTWTSLATDYFYGIIGLTVTCGTSKRVTNALTITGSQTPSSGLYPATTQVSNFVSSYPSEITLLASFSYNITDKTFLTEMQGAAAPGGIPGAGQVFSVGTLVATFLVLFHLLQ